MLIASDLDGTIDSNPREMQSILTALKAAGHSVIVVTGTSGMTATQEDWEEKANYLNSLGLGECWDQLFVIPHVDGDLAGNKARLCESLGVDVMFDNTVENIKAANDIGIPLCLVNWSARVKDK